MLIIAYDKKSFIDFNRYGRVMVSTDGLAVCVLSEENRPWVVGRYNSIDVSQKVLENIADNVLKGTALLQMPSADEADKLYNKPIAQQPWHHATGKKLKRHGGS